MHRRKGRYSSSCVIFCITHLLLCFVNNCLATPSTTCDNLAASPFDGTRPAHVAGMYLFFLDAEKAVPACEQAVKDNPQDRRLLFQLARTYQKCGRNEEAYAAFRKAAEAGHPEAMACLALVLSNGTGVKADAIEAVRWCRKAIESGSSLGMRYLGTMYQFGYGVEKSDKEAMKWYRQSAEAGNSDGMVYLALILLKSEKPDHAAVTQWCRKAAEAGHVDGMVLLGKQLQNGQGVPQDFGEAAMWFRKAAEKGNSDGMLHLGSMYLLGKGVNADDAAGAEWLAKSAKAGNSQGMLLLGLLYQVGRGVAADLAKARDLLGQAAQLGNSIAQYQLCLTYREGKGGPVDTNQALFWCGKAAAQGHNEAKQVHELLVNTQENKTQENPTQGSASPSATKTQPADSESSVQKLAQAQEFYTAGKLHEAIALGKDAVALDDNNLQTKAIVLTWIVEQKNINRHLQKAAEFIEKNDLEKASLELTAAEKFVPSYEPTRQLRNRLNSELSTAEVRKHLEQGVAHANAGNYAAAQAELDQAERLRPGLPVTEKLKSQLTRIATKSKQASTSGHIPITKDCPLRCCHDNCSCHPGEEVCKEYQQMLQEELDDL